MADLRIGVGRIWHESNSFCGLPTTLRDFLDDSSYGGVAVGADVLGRVDRRDEVTGIIEALDGDGGVEIVPLVNAGTLPSGLVAEDAVVVQAELTKVQEEIERLTGRLKLLEQTSAFSLVNVRLQAVPSEMPVDAGTDLTLAVGRSERFRASFTPPEGIDEFVVTWD